MDFFLVGFFVIFPTQDLNTRFTFWKGVLWESVSMLSFSILVLTSCRSFKLTFLSVFTGVDVGVLGSSLF